MSKSKKWVNFIIFGVAILFSLPTIAVEEGSAMSICLKS